MYLLASICIGYIPAQRDIRPVISPKERSVLE